MVPSAPLPPSTWGNNHLSLTIVGLPKIDEGPVKPHVHDVVPTLVLVNWRWSVGNQDVFGADNFEPIVIAHL